MQVELEGALQVEYRTAFFSVDVETILTRGTVSREVRIDPKDGFPRSCAFQETLVK